MTWRWTILGEPVAQGRPKFARVGSFVRTYTPAKSASWKSLAVEALCCAWDGPPLDDVCSVEVVAVFSRPKRLLRARDPDERLPHDRKPDGDNIAKALLDAMQAAGVLRDDARVSELVVRKRYAARHEGPRVEVVLTRIEASPPASVRSLPLPPGGVWVPGAGDEMGEGE